MRFFKGLGLFIFSLIIFTLSIVMILIGLEVIKLEAVASLIPYCFGTQQASIITYSVCGVLVVLSLLCLFGKSNKSKKQEQEKGILLANSDGQLLITKQTIENIVSGVVEHTTTIYDAKPSVIIDHSNNVSVKIQATVVEGAVIKDVSSKLQSDIKNAVKSATDLEVTTVDVAISNMNVNNGQYVQPSAPVTNEYVQPTVVPIANDVSESTVMENNYVAESMPVVENSTPVVESQVPVEPTYENTMVPADDPDVPTIEEIKAEAEREAAEVDAIIASETAKAKKKTTTKRSTTKKTTTAKKATTAKKPATTKKTTTKKTTDKKTTTKKTTKK